MPPLPDGFHEISAEQWEAAPDGPFAEFGIPRTYHRGSPPRDGPDSVDLDVDDPVADYLVEHCEVFRVEKGKVFLPCPWKDEHSDPDAENETEAAWLVAGTKGYPRGHFRCFHASCLGRTRAEFLNAVGFKPVRPEEFDDLGPDEGNSASTGRRDRDDLVALYLAHAPGASPRSKELKAERKSVVRDPTKPLPGFNRDDRNRIETSLENLTMALVAPHAVETELCFDEFRGELLYAEQPGQWQPLTDGYATELAIRLERLGLKDQVGAEKLRRALDWVIEHRRMDTARHWLEHVVPAWDGVPRIHRFWPDYMRTNDTRYTQALGNYSWTAQAGRILEPGLQVDMVPVLVGAEGLRKTSAIKAIAPHKEFYGEFRFDAKDEDLARLMRGKLVGELAELRGVSARDAEGVLAWITRTDEEWTPKFKEYAISLARRLVFYGTTNDAEFLQAHMGQRRWLPVMILDIIDTWLIERDRLQLWAEARDVFLHDGGLQFEEVERLAKAERDAFKYVDPWHHQVGTWLDQGPDDDATLTPRRSGKLRSEEVLTQCLGIDASRIRKPDQMRIGEVLRAHGMVRNVGWLNGHTARVWVDGAVVRSGGKVGDKRVRKGRS